MTEQQARALIGEYSRRERYKFRVVRYEGNDLHGMRFTCVNPRKEYFTVMVIPPENVVPVPSYSIWEPKNNE